MEKVLKAIHCEIKQESVNDEERSFLAVASTEDIDRDGDRIMAAGWDVENFLKNPVIPWSHNYGEPPVARATEIGVRDGRLEFRPQFAKADEYPFADTIWKLYKGGYLKAFSVGFRPKRWEWVERGKGVRGRDYQEQELWEISACTVPSNPHALVAAKGAGVITAEQAAALESASRKDVCGSIELPIESLADGTGRDWDADAAKGRIREWAGGPEKEDIDWERYARAFVWTDGPEDTFDSYQLPFADVVDGDLTAMWGGVSAAMGAVLGAMGGIDLSEENRRACYAFLSGYYEKWEKELPEFKDSDAGGRTPGDKIADDLRNSKSVLERLDELETLLLDVREGVIALAAVVANSRVGGAATNEAAGGADETQDPPDGVQVETIAEILAEAVGELLPRAIRRAVDDRIKYQLGIVE